MANPLPILRNTTGGLNAQVLYPFVRVVSFLTHVNQFDNATEQRWVGRVPLFNFLLPMSSLGDTDKAAWLAFFNTVLGRFSQDLSITLGSTTYSDLTMQEDDLLVTVPGPTTFNQQITLRQVKNYPWTVPSAGSTYPSFKFGGSIAIAVAEYPFGQGNAARTDVNDSPYGQRYAYAWYKAFTPRDNYPSSLLKAWKLSYPLLTDADATTLENFFLGCQGRYKSFTFVDPLDASSNANCRFDMDDISFKYVTKNMQQTEVTIKQVWA